MAPTTVFRAAGFDFDAVFRRDYARIARLVARVIGDRDRAEDIAVEAFWRLWRTPLAHSEAYGGWVYRTALNLAFDELRRRTRRARYEAMLPFTRPRHRPDELMDAADMQRRVRGVLAAMPARDASLLVLHGEGYTYEEMAQALSLNAASVGTLISRARAQFRKAYVRRHGEE